MAEYTIEKIIRNWDEYCLGWSGGWSSDLYNIKYLVVWGGWAYSQYYWGWWWEVCYNNKGFNETSINVYIWCGWYYNSSVNNWLCKDWWPTMIRNNEFNITARWWIWWACYCCVAYVWKSWSWYGSTNTSWCAGMGWWWAWWVGTHTSWWIWLCWYWKWWSYGSWDASACGDWWGYNQGWKCWIVEICYIPWTSWFTTATWGNSCFTCWDYCVHRFTSNWTFCITG